MTTHDDREWAAKQRLDREAVVAWLTFIGMIVGALGLVLVLAYVVLAYVKGPGQ